MVTVNHETFIAIEELNIPCQELINCFKKCVKLEIKSFTRDVEIFDSYESLKRGFLINIDNPIALQNLKLLSIDFKLI